MNKINYSETNIPIRTGSRGQDYLIYCEERETELMIESSKKTRKKKQENIV